MDVRLDAQVVLALIGTDAPKPDAPAKELRAEHGRLLSILQEMVGHKTLGVSTRSINVGNDLNGALEKSLNLQTFGSDLEDSLKFFYRGRHGQNFRAAHLHLNLEQSGAKLDDVVFSIAELRAPAVKDELERLVWMLADYVRKDPLKLAFIETRRRHLPWLRHKGNR